MFESLETIPEILEFEVSQQDINEGEQLSTRGCPIALAGSRFTGLHVEMGATLLRVPTEQLAGTVLYEAEEDTWRWRSYFDMGKEGEPFTARFKKFKVF